MKAIITAALSLLSAVLLQFGIDVTPETQSDIATGLLAVVGIYLGAAEVYYRRKHPGAPL